MTGEECGWRIPSAYPVSKEDCPRQSIGPLGSAHTWARTSFSRGSTQTLQSVLILAHTSGAYVNRVRGRKNVQRIPSAYLLLDNQHSGCTGTSARSGRTVAGSSPCSSWNKMTSEECGWRIPGAYPVSNEDCPRQPMVASGSAHTWAHTFFLEAASAQSQTLQRALVHAHTPSAY